MRLGVNIDHVATVREARKTREPEPVSAAVLAELGGADGITVHLRADRRHIQQRDVTLLQQVVATRLNVEMATSAEMIEIAANVKPNSVTLVPEKPNELTTTGGLDVGRHASLIKKAVNRLQKQGVKVAIFVDPEESQVKHSKSVGATAVEINTGPYADAHGSERREELRRVVQTATAATREGLDVLAGHGLTYLNVDPIVEIDEIVELNIGHSIVARAVLVGMERAVMEMVDLLRRS
jgi:pyridoxine 5-phosphate synthase